MPHSESRYPERMSSRAPSRVQIARSQWLLGLDAPESTDEIRRAWKERVARTHPDRNATRAGAATRVTAAFNQARELCEWWLEAGEAWPKPMPPEALRTPEPERVVRPPARTPEENRSSFRAGDLVVRAVPGREPSPGARAHVHASGPGEDGRVELDDGSSAAPGELAPVAYGCPVCGKCAGPAVEQPALRPCPECLEELVRLERSERAVEPALRGMRSRARAGRATAAELGDSGLEELARERFRWAESVGRRPREERRGRILAAYAHAYALWAARAPRRAREWRAVRGVRRPSIEGDRVQAPLDALGRSVCLRRHCRSRRAELDRAPR